MRIYQLIIGVLVSLVSLILSASHSYARQAYQHAWFSVDVGSMANQTGGYSLRGVAGQAHAGELKAGEYTLTGGVLRSLAMPPHPTREKGQRSLCPA